MATATKEFEKLNFDYNTGKIKRVFTKEWSESGFINMNKLPDMVASLVEQRKSMIEYIDQLHDKIDNLMEHNKICTNQHCHTAFCESEHK